MGTGYTRNDTSNNIADGNVINASDLDGEFDAIQSAFDASTGHSHDGTTGEGPQIGASGIANDAVALGTKTTGNYVAAGAVSGVGLSGSASAEGATFTVSSNATDANTASTIVARDASGNFSAGTITASLTGTASNADQLDSLDSTSFLRSDAADTKTSGDLSFSDNVKAVFGAGSDLQIYHSGSHSFIQESGTGSLFIDATDLQLRNSAGQTYVNATSGGSVILRYAGSEKLETTSGGIDVTGTITFDGGTTSADLNFGDNDKAVFGAGSDLQIYHDGSNSIIHDNGTGVLKLRATDFRLSNAGNTQDYIACTDGGDVDLSFNGAVKLSTKTDGVNITGELEADSLNIDGVADFTGKTTHRGGVSLLDSDVLTLGTSDDLQIYHDGSNSYIEDTATGDLRIKGVDVVIQQSDGNNQIASQSGGAVSLSHNGSTKLATTSGGINVTGEVQADSIVMNDSETIYLGNSADLRIYHDGTNSRIDDAGTGNLVIRGNSAITLGKYTGETMLEGIADGAVSLYHNNIKKFETTSVGVTVSGDIIGPASADFDIKTGSGTGEMLFHTNSLERVRIGLDGKVGIGQSATTDLLEVNGDVRAVDFNATSDERLKSNIRQIENALDKVCQMNGMHYVLDGKESSGVIAQNIQTVAPEAVSDSGEHLTVAYNQLIGYLIEAVKELKTEVEELKNGNTPSVS
jgi:hypothetical protein